MNLFPNAWHVARREYFQRVQGRSFLIVTAILAVVGLGLALTPLGIRLIGGDEQTQVGLLASPDTVQAAQLEATLNAGLADDATGYAVVPVDDEAAGRQQARDGDLAGLLLVTRGADQDLSFDYVSDAGPTSQTLIAVRSASSQLAFYDRLERAGIDQQEAGQIFAPAAFDVQPVTPSTGGNGGAPEGAFDGPRGFVAYILVILTFMAVVTYGTWVATSVAEEKSSRVMELLITAASPRQLLAGKVLGTGAAGLTQYLAILVAALVGLVLQIFLAQRLFGTTGQNVLEGVDFTVLIPFSLFFVPGFMLYCVLYAGFGSMASRQEDVTQVTGPMLFIGMGGYFASFVAMATPDAGWVKVLSLIPFFSPYLLTARYELGSTVAPWEWAVAGALMLLFLLGALWLAARIYSAGVLLYGQRSSLRRVWSAVRVDR
jgi:ABC-2 type transport system permease protein